MRELRWDDEERENRVEGEIGITGRKRRYLRFGQVVTAEIRRWPLTSKAAAVSELLSACATTVALERESEVRKG